MKEDIISIKNAGQLFIIDDIKNGPGMKKSKNFLELIARGFAKHCTTYVDEMGEANFGFGERQISSVLAPVISQISPTFLMEYPLIRNWSRVKRNDKMDSHGWVDYWCRFRKSDFLLELKSNRENLKSKKIRKDLLSNWRYMQNEQLAGLDKEAKILKEYCNSVVSIGLHVIPFVQRIHMNQDLASKEDLINKLWEYHESLDPDPNWSCLWILHDRLRYTASNYLSENKDQYYPAVLLVAKASCIRPSKKK